MSVYGLCLRAISAGSISAFCRDLREDGCTGTTGDIPADGGAFTSRPEPIFANASAAPAGSIPIPPLSISPPPRLVSDPPPPPKPDPDCWLSPPAKSCGKGLPDADPGPDPDPNSDWFEPIPPNNCIPSERSPGWSV